LLYQIILKNFKSSWKNYFVYFTGNIIGVAEFFVFLGLYSVSKVIMKDASADFGTIQDVMFACILVCIFSVAIMTYSMQKFMRLRLREYQLFYVLGMKRRKMYGMILFEYFSGCLGTLFAGMLAGRLMLGGVLKAWHYFFPEYIRRVPITVSVYMDTCKLSVAVFLAVAFSLLVWADNHGLQDLMNDGKKKEKKPQSRKWLVFTVAGVLLIAAGYWIYARYSLDYGYLYSHLFLNFGTFFVVLFGGGILLEILHKRRKFYLKHLLGLNGLYSRYQSNMLFFLMIFTVQFAAVGYCGVQIAEILPISGQEKYFPYDAVWMGKDTGENQNFVNQCVKEYKGSVKKFPMIRVSGYSVELVGISEKTYEQLSGKQVHLKNKEIVYIQNEYKTYNGKKVTMGAMDYGRKGYTWLMPGSFDKGKDEYVSPESNHPIASKDWDHLYRMKRIEAGNWFGKYRIGVEAENVVVFSENYFNKWHEKLKKEKEEPDLLYLFSFPDRTEKQGTKELQKNVNKYGNQDYGLTDEVQKTLYVTATFVTELEKSLLFQLSNKAFFFLALLVSGNFALFVKTASELPDYRKRYEFLSCMGITKKMKKRTLAWEVKLLPEITAVAVLLLSAGYVEMEKIRESYLGVVHGKEVWIYWGCLSAGYILLTEVMLELLKKWVAKRVEEGNRR